MQKDLGLGGFKTAWMWLHKVHSALHERTGFPLTGLVEADETYVGVRNERDQALALEPPPLGAGVRWTRPSEGAT